jgi:hypothetical protein
MFFNRFCSISMLSCALLCGSFSAQSGWAADLSRLVVVGDSISAGVENFSLEQDQQIHGYASVIATQAATQANVQLTLPLVPFPGAPNTLQLTSLNPITVTQVSGSLPPIPRVNPCDQPTNVSVPGVTLDQALTMVPTANTSGSPVQDWANIVLGFPNPFGIGAGLCAGPASAPQTEVQQAVALKPTAIITWLGNNDVLVPAMIGALNMLTPLNTFTISYGKLLDTLGQTKAPILTATIPDVTKVPFFTPLTVLAARVNLSVNTVADKLGLDSNDLLRPTAVPIATAILQGQQQGPLPTTCPAPVALQALTPNVPCVLKAGDAAYIRGTVGIFNVIIFAQSLAHGATVVDIHGLVDKLAQNGYTTAAGKTLTTGFLGGLISLDGVHPTNTGYGIIANTFIDTMNRWWGTAIPHADIDKIAATDPLVAPFPPPPFTVNSSN